MPIEGLNYFIQHLKALYLLNGMYNINMKQNLLKKSISFVVGKSLKILLKKIFGNINFKVYINL